MEDTARPKCLNILYMRICKYCSQSETTENTSYPLYCFLYLKERHYLVYSTGNKYPYLNHSLILTDMITFLLIAELHVRALRTLLEPSIREILVIT